MVLFFLGGTFADGFMCWTALQNGFDVFSEKLKNLIFFQGILLNGFICFFGFGQRLGLPLQNGFGSFLKTTNIPTKWFVVFLGKCKLIDSKMIEPYRMVYKIPGNLKISEVISTKWFVK